MSASAERALELGTLLVLLAVAAGAALNVVGWNDFMYGVGPVLGADAELYREIPFTQAPGSFVLLAGLAELVGDAAFYASARIASALLAAGCLLLVYDIARRLADERCGRLALVFALSSNSFPSIAQEIGNYSLVLFLLLLSTRVALLSKGGVRDWAVIGACLGLSVATKLTQVLFAIPFGLWLVRRHGFDPARIAACALCGLVAGLPLFVHLARDFEATWFWNVDFHFLVYLDRGLDRARSLVQIGRFTLEMLSMGLVPVALLGASLGLTRRGGAPPGLRPLALLTAFAYAVAASPGMLFDQYLAPVTALLAVAAAVGAPVVLRAFPSPAPFDLSRRWRVLWLATVLGAIPYLVEFADDRLPRLLEGRIVPVQLARLHTALEELSDRALAPGACPPTALSFTSVPLLGGSFEISPFGAASLFAAEVDEFMRDGEYDSMRVHTSLAAELERSAPSLVLAGFYEREEAEQELLAYLREAGYRPVEVGELGRFDMTAWLRPGCLR